MKSREVNTIKAGRAVRATEEKGARSRGHVVLLDGWRHLVCVSQQYTVYICAACSPG